MSLYSLDSKIKACIQLDAEHVVDTEDGEILNLEQFEALQMERTAKLENLACYIKNVEAEAEAIHLESQILSRRGKAKKAEAKRCRDYMAQILNGEKFETPRCKVSWRKTAACNILDLTKVPDEYKRITVDANKEAIKKAIKAGTDVPGTEIVEYKSMVLK